MSVLILSSLCEDVQRKSQGRAGAGKAGGGGVEKVLDDIMNDEVLPASDKKGWYGFD